MFGIICLKTSEKIIFAEHSSRFEKNWVFLPVFLALKYFIWNTPAVKNSNVTKTNSSRALFLGKHCQQKKLI